jgi:hypothetical protein
MDFGGEDLTVVGEKISDGEPILKKLGSDWFGSQYGDAILCWVSSTITVTVPW